MLAIEVGVLVKNQGKSVFMKDNINVVDLSILCLHVASYIFEGCYGGDIFFPEKQVYILVRCTKMFRGLKMLYHY